MKKKEIDYHSNVGLSMYNMKRYDESIYQFKKSIKKDPKYDQLHCLLALILIKQKNYKEAADVMEGAFSVHQIDKTEFTYYTMGTLLFKQGTIPPLFFISPVHFNCILIQMKETIMEEDFIIFHDQ